jgi:hypothetical protein
MGTPHPASNLIKDNNPEARSVTIFLRPTVIVSYASSKFILLVPILLHGLPSATNNMAKPVGFYSYSNLARETSFRILELLPGKDGDTVLVVLHPSDLNNHRDYEAISYPWGDTNSRAAFLCDGRRVVATRNLHSNLSHLRLDSESRFLWADALW